MDMKILYFTKEGCDTCPPVKAKLKDVGATYKTVDCYERPDLAGQYKVLATPTLVVLKGIEVHKHVGRDACLKAIEELF